MSRPRLWARRVTSAKFLGVFSLEQHDHRIHKASKDGSGKFDAFHTGKQSDVVIGVLYEIDESEKSALDKAEGLGYGYNEKEVCVRNTTGKAVNAVTYYADSTKINESLLPYSWYMEHVLFGAKQANLPLEYIAGIEAIKAISDPDLKRAARERSIYRNLESNLAK